MNFLNLARKTIVKKIIGEKYLYNYLRNNVGWLCPAGSRCKCWLHRFFKEFEMTFKSKWITYYESKIFRKRLYLKYRKESIHGFDYCYYY